jgi:hypothetical protein
MVEQFTNLLWLAITLVTTLTWMIITRNQPMSRHRLLQVGTALGCVFMLLFPVISMTDDLHFELALFECGDQRHLTMIAGTDDHGSPGGTAVWAACLAILPVRMALESHGPFSNLPPVVEVCPSTIVEPLPPDRAPPSSSL